MQLTTLSMWKKIISIWHEFTKGKPGSVNLMVSCHDTTAWLRGEQWVLSTLTSAGHFSLSLICQKVWRGWVGTEVDREHAEWQGSESCGQQHRVHNTWCFPGISIGPSFIQHIHQGAGRRDRVPPQVLWGYRTGRSVWCTRVLCCQSVQTRELGSEERDEAQQGQMQRPVLYKEWLHVPVQDRNWPAGK